ncbi:hypothetical protein [Reinekea sp. G2M2-21]|uniref:hypothetical protein n=1 Tax=Reinekea sp. G2M2-21 TaxID=2788942 RepID=UPI0018AB89D2|nr:hypothetical protein [Reinekea sp. G2M2-21]
MAAIEKTTDHKTAKRTATGELKRIPSQIPNIEKTALNESKTTATQTRTLFLVIDIRKANPTAKKKNTYLKRLSIPSRIPN